MLDKIIISREIAGRFPIIWNTIIDTVQICLNPKRIAWAFLDNKGIGSLYIDGQEIHIPGGLAKLVFSENGASFGYILNLKERIALVINGIEKSVNGDWATDLTFSPDGSICGFMSWTKKGLLSAKDQTELNVVINNKSHGPYSAASLRADNPIVFSQIGNHYGFFAYRGEKAFAIIDAVELGPYDDISGGTPIFSYDGSRHIFNAQIGNQWTIVDKGKPGELFDGIIQHSKSLSANGKHMAYACGRGSEKYLVVDDKIVESFKDCHALPRLNSDGSLIAKIILGRRRPTEVIVGERVLNKHDDPEYVDISSFTWSPGSRIVAYLCPCQNKFYVMINTKREGPYDNILKPGIFFSADGRHYAYFAKMEDAYHLVFDGIISTDKFHWPLQKINFRSDETLIFADVSIIDKTIYWVEAKLLD